MKVLVGYTVSKTLTEGNMDSSIDLPSNGDVRKSSTAVENVSDQITGINRWRRLFLQIQKNKDSQAEAPHGCQFRTALFGQPLSAVCEEDGSPPKPIKDVLKLLLKRGPSAEGIFRKPANAKRLREIKDQLDRGVEVEMEVEQTTLLAALLKDFLRHIPGGLLVADYSQAWMMALESEDPAEKRIQLKLVHDSLPKANAMLLQHLLCVLLHISRNSSTNKMDAKNLAVCISPNLLQWDDVDMVEKVTSLTQFLIEDCCGIFGEDILTLLGDPDDEELSDNLDSLSHQQDLAYESNDPDTDCDLGGSMEGQLSVAHHNKQNRLKVDSSLTNGDLRTSPPFNRRRSEPIICLPTGRKPLLMVARSHDDLKKERSVSQLLKKQTSETCFLLLNRNSKRQAARHVDSSYSSSCSLESASSSLSDDAVTITKSVARSNPSRRAFSTVRREEPKNHAKMEKRRSMSMRIEKPKNLKFKSRWSLKKVPTQSEALIQSEAAQNEVENDTDRPDPVPKPRPLSMSTTEVFKLVDSRIPSPPPSYEQAINSTASLQFQPKTVQDARSFFRDRRLSFESTTNDLFTEKFSYEGTAEEAPVGPFRQRAMSESVSDGSSKRLSRRISQPLIEAILTAKESYV
ncbi:T-cell activation Rho GTPase-activating protein-like [Brienomyrus brachyistius]|uniref:T-cell activation Rho GTPase-activating protein-like n=1 Tax=Brienomyrus brachyistius TaxID=42636 RepID=UPI0020B2672C|nr:T-cell activation Rho GTPase-activating protein-like [Brienomyrus brachyistius]